MALRYIFIDFDSYFASCEQQLNPKLRGVPVAVVPMMAESTCCIAASYEAKAFGVRTGTRVSEARWLCPHIRFVEARHAEYVQLHHKAVAAVESCIPVAAVMSIDEMYARIPPNWQNEERIQQLIGEIRQAIKDSLGEWIGCSIGVAPNVFLSKLGSGMNKPRGVTILRMKDIPESLYGLKLEDFYGIGKRMLKRLSCHGITTVKQLYEADRRTLRTVWGGVEGERFYAALRGEDWEREETMRRQVSHSHVLPPERRNPEDAFAVLHRLTQKAAMRLRKLEHYAASYWISVRFANGFRWKKGTTFFPTQNTPFFLEKLRDFWSDFPEQHVPLKVSLVLGELIPADQYTPSLFTVEKDRRQEILNRTVDGLNFRYGSRTLYYAGSHTAMKEAPMRIAFNHIPDLEAERD